MKPIDLVKECAALRQERDAAVARLRQAGQEAGQLLTELDRLRSAVKSAEDRNDALCARIVELEDNALAALEVQ